MAVAKAECSRCHHILPKTQMTSREERGEGSVGLRTNNKGTRGVSYYRGRKRTIWICNDCNTFSNNAIEAAPLLIVYGAAIVIFLILFA